MYREPRDASLAVELRSPAVRVIYQRGQEGRIVRHIEQLEVITAPSGRGSPVAVAGEYIRDNAEILGLSADMLELNTDVADVRFDRAKGTKLHYAGEKAVLETTTVEFAQTYQGVPVWQGGTSVVVNKYPDGDLWVTALSNSVQKVPDVIGFGNPASDFAPANLNAATLNRVLGLAGGGSPYRVTEINQASLRLYRYRAADRQPPSDNARNRFMEGHDFSMPLPPFTGREGMYYLVSDVVFSTKVKDRQPGGRPGRDAPQDAAPVLNELTWRGLINVEDGRVLYLRALVSGCFDELFPPEATSPGTATFPGMVLLADPLTSKGTDPFTSSAPLDDATVGSLRKSVQLINLEDSSSFPRLLIGSRVKIEDLELPRNSVGADFAGPVAFEYEIISQAEDFTAVNAYYHTDAMFRMLSRLGLHDVYYPAGTTPMLKVDSQGRADSVNALVAVIGGGSFANRIYYGRAKPGREYGNALDVRVVLHEFSHVLIYNSTESLNLPFAHSAGDALAAILSDPCTKLKDEARFETFPWLTKHNSQHPDYHERKHGGKSRTVEKGWAWRGPEYNADSWYGYLREQILSTTLFRLYRAIGGDATSNNSPNRNAANIKRLAARHAAYVLIRAIAELPNFKNMPLDEPEIFATQMMSADTATDPYNDLSFPSLPMPGGMLRKVVEWSFEKQGLYQPPQAPTDMDMDMDTGDVMTEGQVGVDVYIDRNRRGYEHFTTEFGGTLDIWNRHQDDGLDEGEHQEPKVEQTNFVYVEIKNRGHAQATNVHVEGYFEAWSEDLVWEMSKWTQKMEPATLPCSGVAPAPSPTGDPGTCIVGPFTWIPPGVGKWCLLFSVSAEGDLSNIDPATPYPCEKGPSPLWRLIPLDNNIAARKVTAG